ncbi:hypothetical protein BH24ACT23_BH24ACT23_09560 [soil metagenome]
MAEGSNDNLEELTVADLRERASELEITGRSSMKKDELVTAVSDAEEQTAAMDARGSESKDEPSASESDSDEGAASSGEIDASDIPAPSIGPNTTINLKPPEERLDHDKISDIDAMGLDKRRQIQGERYGASPLKQVVVYGAALTVIIALFVGGKLLVDELDTTPPINNNAPWAKGAGTLEEPAPLDFPYTTNP